MSGNFWIKYEIAQVDCTPPDEGDNALFEAFMEYVVVGSVVIGFGEESFAIPECGLLGLSRSLIRLCTFPVLYDLEAFESVYDTSIDFRSTFRDGNVELSITWPPEYDSVFHIPLSEALRTVGTFNRNVLRDYFSACPDIRLHGALLVRIPDAFVLAHTP